MKNVIKLCIIIFITLFAVQFAVANDDSSVFLGKWEVTAEDYESIFVFIEDTVFITEVNLESEILPWSYNSENKTIMIDQGTYTVKFIDENNLILTPIGAPDWMNEMKFSFKKEEE